jgi:hypothetical protein
MKPKPSTTEISLKKWNDGKEKSLSGYIPDGWSAQHNVFRPYTSMIGSIFSASPLDDSNTLIYVFQPFMPLHLNPSNICEFEIQCEHNGDRQILRSDSVRQLGMGNAPFIISPFLDPEEYFRQDVLPILSSSLKSYEIISSSSNVVASVVKDKIVYLPLFEINYKFVADGKEVNGIALVSTQNYTSHGTGYWKGSIVGIESTKEKFEDVYKQGVASLFTLKYDDGWIDREKSSLLQGIQSHNNTDFNGIHNNELKNELENISFVIANSTLDNFDSTIHTAAAKMARSVKNTTTAGYENINTLQRLELPIFPDVKHWFLSSDGNYLIGRGNSRNPLGTNILEMLFV